MDETDDMGVPPEEQGTSDSSPKVSRRAIWLIAGAVAAVVVGLSIAWFTGLIGPNGTKVPNVIGLTEADARSVLLGAGFAVGEIAEQPSDEPVGIVLGQSPLANAEADSAASVDLLVSSGPEVVDVPTLIGLNKAEAVAALEAAGLSANLLPDEYSADFKFGIVIRQLPAPGESVAPGSVVAFVASGNVKAPGTSATLKPPSDGSTPAEPTSGDSGSVKFPTDPGQNNVGTVPRVIGMSRDRAIETLREYGFSYAVKEAYSGTVAAGTVFDQSPKPGSSALGGTAITITVSKGPEQLRVPNVVGLSEAVAKSKIVEAGLRAVVVYELRKGTGDVTAQSPRPGTVLDGYATVTITVDARAGR